MPDILGIRHDSGPRPQRLEASDRVSAERLRAKEALSSVQEGLASDFQQALENLEKAQTHVQSARAYIKPPDERADERRLTRNSYGSTTGREASSSDGQRRVDFKA